MCAEQDMTPVSLSTVLQSYMSCPFQLLISRPRTGRSISDADLMT